MIFYATRPTLTGCVISSLSFHPFLSLPDSPSIYSLKRFQKTWINIVLIAILLAPGIYGIIQLHPYEYTYYNSLVGGTSGVFRHYETDYWLTCYKQAVEEFDQLESEPVNLYIHREPEVAAPYAASNVKILDERGALQSNPARRFCFGQYAHQ